MKQEILISDNCWSLNQVINTLKGRKGMYFYTNYKRQWTRYIVLACKEQNIQPMKTPIRVSVQQTYSTKRRRDPDNQTFKFILDGLVEAGILSDDSFDEISSLTVLTPKIEKKTKQTRIILENDE